MLERFRRLFRSEYAMADLTFIRPTYEGKIDGLDDLPEYTDNADLARRLSSPFYRYVIRSQTKWEIVIEIIPKFGEEITYIRHFFDKDQRTNFYDTRIATEKNGVVTPKPAFITRPGDVHRPPGNLLYRDVDPNVMSQIRKTGKIPSLHVSGKGSTIDFFDSFKSAFQGTEAMTASNFSEVPWIIAIDGDAVEKTRQPDSAFPSYVVKAPIPAKVIRSHWMLPPYHFIAGRAFCHISDRTIVEGSFRDVLVSLKYAKPESKHIIAQVIPTIARGSS